MSKKLVAATVAAGLLTTGCVAISGNQHQASTTNAPVWAAHVNYDGSGLEVIDVRDWHNRDKGMRVLATLKSNALSVIDFQYRFVWYAHDGQPIKTVLSTWKTRRALRGQTLEIEGFSPGVRAADYRLEIIQN